MSVIYEGGTSATSSKTTGMGVGLTPDGGLIPAIGGGRSKGVQQTELARRLAPPARPEDSGALGCAIMLTVLLVIGMPLLVCVGFGADLVAVLAVPIVLGMVVIYPIGIWRQRVIGRAQAAHPAEQERWERSWLCHRCGEVFESSDGATGDNPADATTPT